MSRLKLLKFLDRYLGKPILYLIFCIYSPKTAALIPKDIKQILIIRPGGIGDFILLLPSIHYLKSKFPRSRIDVLCEKRNAGVAALSDSINKIYLYDKGLDILKCLKNKYDVVIDSEQWHKLSAAVTYLTGAPIRIGFDTNERNKAFTHKISYSHDDYEMYSFFHLIEPITGGIIDFDAGKPFINVPSVFPDNFLSIPEEERGKIISIFPGASVVERKWEADKFAEVAEAVNRCGYRVVILGSHAERKDAELIKKRVNTCIDLTGNTELKDVALVLKASRLLLTADSGLMHLACAVGISTVLLFGAGIEKKWAPKGGKHVIINRHLSCSPCTRFGYTPRCRKNVECLALIDPDEVIKTINIILSDGLKI